MTTYALTLGPTVKRDDGRILSDQDPTYLAWLADGGTPTPLPPRPARTATAKQIRYALSDLGVRDAWETAAGPGKATQAVQDWWGWTDPVAEDATKLGRLCKAVGITPAALLDKATSE